MRTRIRISCFLFVVFTFYMMKTWKRNIPQLVHLLVASRYFILRKMLGLEIYETFPAYERIELTSCNKIGRTV